MRKRKVTIIRLLLGWWAFCLAGQCLAMPVHQSLDAGASAGMTLSAGEHCAGEQALVCDDSSVISAFFLVLAAALPLMLWLVSGMRQSFSSVLLVPEVWRNAPSPPLYLLSQRFRV